MSAPEKKPGGGFALFGLVVGLATGLAIYAIVQYWIGEASDAPLAQTVLAVICAFSAALLLLAERGATLRAIAPAALIAAILALPTYSMLVAARSEINLAPFPALFWFIVGAPLSGYLMVTLAKASLMERAPPPYGAVFFHGMTLPLIAGGAKFFAVLATVLLFAWALLLRSMDVDFFHRLFQEPWFMLPFFGAIGGLSLAMMRGLESVLGALRFILLLFCRIAMPITAVFSLTLMAILVMKGPTAIFIGPVPSLYLLGLAFAAMLIFNGVYQNGEGGPPPAWLRLATIIALITFPIYIGLAAYAFWLRVGEYGLTPPRFYGFVMTGLAALYSVVCLAGVLTELNWSGKRWMPLVAPLNTAMAVIWIAVLVVLASPLVNAWELSASSQEKRLLEGRVKASEFDFGYLRFGLGPYGERVLGRLADIENHPEAAEIRASVARVRAAASRWEYDQGAAPAEPLPSEAETGSAQPPGLMDLPLNPGDEETTNDPAEAEQPSGRG